MNIFHCKVFSERKWFMRGCGKAEILFRNHFSISISHSSCHLGFAMPRFSAASKQKWGGIRRPHPMSGKTGRESPTLPVSNIKRRVGVGVGGCGCGWGLQISVHGNRTQRKQNQCFSVAICTAVPENGDILLHENHNRNNKCSFWNSPPVTNVVFCPHLFFFFTFSDPELSVEAVLLPTLPRGLDSHVAWACQIVC